MDLHPVSITVEHLDGWTDDAPRTPEPTTICWFDVPEDGGVA